MQRSYQVTLIIVSTVSISVLNIHSSHPSIIYHGSSYYGVSHHPIPGRLVDDPRNSLKKWLEAVEYVARTLCAAWDISGALTLVADDATWTQFPGNITNLADVIANGDPPDIRVRPTWDAPPAHANNAASAVISIFRQANDKHQAYNIASVKVNNKYLQLKPISNYTSYSTASTASTI